MSSLLSKIKVGSGRRHDLNDNEDEQNLIKSKRTRINESSAGAGKRKGSSVHTSAARRGLYARHGRSSAHTQASAAMDGDGHSDDRVIKNSMYPQLNGKRRSELEAAVHAQSVMVNQESSETRNHDNTVLSRRLVYKWRIPSHEDQTGGKESQSRSKLASESHLTEDLSACTTSSRASKRSSLPADEYQFLTRRQRMQHAREVMEAHYTQAHLAHSENIGIRHGMMQAFSVRNTERRRISKMQFAVRKALRADLDILNGDFMLAFHQRAEGVRFSGMSDVDGVPIDEHMMYEFIRMYQDAQTAADLLQTSSIQSRKPAKRTWIDERYKRMRQAALARERADGVETVDAGIMTKQPALVSKFSWGSSDESDTSMQNRPSHSKID